MYTCKINLFTKSVSQMIHIIKYSTFKVPSVSYSIFYGVGKHAMWMILWEYCTDICCFCLILTKSIALYSIRIHVLCCNHFTACLCKRCTLMWSNECNAITYTSYYLLNKAKFEDYQWGSCGVLKPHSLTLKRLGNFFQNVILFSNVVHHKCNIFIWNWSNAMNV